MKKAKRVLALLLCLVLILSAVGCSAKKDDGKKSSDSEVVTVVDNNGNTVTVKKDIQRIVVCDIYPIPSVLAVFFDSASKIVGMAQPSMAAAKNSLLSELYPEILNAETGFIDGTTVNMEALAALNPDVVFYSSGNKELGKQLTDAGYAAIAISANKWQYNAIETLNNWIDLLSQLFPENNKSEKVRTYSESVYNMVQERVSSIPDAEKAKVFFLFQYSASNISTSGNSFFGQWWATAIGAKNVGEELDSDKSTNVNMEQIYKWNPDFIFITNFNTAKPDDIYNNTVGSFDWSGIKAVKDKNVYKMPLGMYRTYTAGVDTPITLLWLAKATYPERFEDIDITAKTKEYYGDVFGITLTD
ncbi:MAG: ABC transporter substrate-binding protein, partial [Clostridia bacterium]|nr:ABC transporter substrate-binding protein [Clostridia bacterium]